MNYTLSLSIPPENSMSFSLILFFFFLLPTANGYGDFFTSPSSNLLPNGNDIDIHPVSIYTSLPLSPPPSPSPPQTAAEASKFSPFKPSMAVIVGVLTTMFSVTFLLLLYAKHCKGGGVVAIGLPPHNRSWTLPESSYAERKNSGIDRMIIESLPIFKFSSLRGQKEGLECAVCLSKFAANDVLRLLPKCNHGFHAECVDTWLDTHSTCPLCRYRVAMEDILLIGNNNFLPSGVPFASPIGPQSEKPEEQSSSDHVVLEVDNGRSGFWRVSGRHSSAGEGATRNLLQTRFSERKSADSDTAGCFDRRRKDGLLLTGDGGRFDHRIIVSPRLKQNPEAPFCHRWSDIAPSDLLYLQSEMIISNGGGSSSATRNQVKNSEESAINGGRWSCRGEINWRCVSEISGVRRREEEDGGGRHKYDEEQRKRQVGVVSRWLGWISQTRPAVPSGSIT